MITFCPACGSQIEVNPTIKVVDKNSGSSVIIHFEQASVYHECPGPVEDKEPSIPSEPEDEEGTSLDFKWSENP